MCESDFLFRLRLGVLAIQGAFIEHVRSLKKATKSINSLSNALSIDAEIFEIRDLEMVIVTKPNFHFFVIIINKSAR